MDIFEVTTKDGSQTVYGCEFEKGVYFSGLYQGLPTVTDNINNFCPVGYTKDEAIDWMVNPERGAVLFDIFKDGLFNFYPDGSEERYIQKVRTNNLRRELKRVGVDFNFLSVKQKNDLLKGKETKNAFFIQESKNGVLSTRYVTIKPLFDRYNDVTLVFNDQQQVSNKLKM